ncbi:MAG: globin family protein [Thermoflexales bacterium]
MEQRQIALVRETFKQVEPIAQEVGDLFYNRLFEIDPPLQQLFRGDMKRQALMLMTVLGLVVRSLDRPALLAEAVRELGLRHERYGVRPEDYHTFGAALLWSLEQVLGDRFTADVRAAWIEAFDMLAASMSKAEQSAA